LGAAAVPPVAAFVVERGVWSDGSPWSLLGLGLYIAKGLVKAHGGRLWCESVPDEETTFVFTLPTSMVKDSAAA
jgi:signal transduction histidine kinase